MPCTSHSANFRYAGLNVPPLPDKKFMAKFGEEFERKRAEKLERWLNRVTRHPVLGQDRRAVYHFLTVKDGKPWKVSPARPGAEAAAPV